MIYKRFLILLLLSSILSCQGVREDGTTTRSSQPNIVFIMVDDLSKEWISAYGAEDIKTPHIDELAAGGMIFDHAYSMPQCTPSRLSLLTGQYPYRHGWVNHWDVPRWGGGAHFDETKYPSLGKTMQAAGYKTCIAGKWQIDDFRVEPDALTRAGFDAYCMWPGYETGVPASAERYQDPYIYTEEGARTYEGAFGPDVFTDFIIDFIGSAQDEPYFVYYPMVLTHTPLVDTPDEHADDDLGKHKAMVRYTDKLTGRVVSALKTHGQLENTIIVWTTDNGTTGKVTGGYNNRSIQGSKMRLTEPGICQPFIVSWPGVISAGSRSDALIDFTDILPTFADIADVHIIRESSHVVDGTSFLPVLMGAEDGTRDWIISMGGGNNARLTDEGVQNQYRFRDRVVRNKRYKLYIDANQNPSKFYNIEDDPAELENIINALNTPDRQENYTQLSMVISTFPAKDNDPQYTPNPPQKWDAPITAQADKWKK